MAPPPMGHDGVSLDISGVELAVAQIEAAMAARLPAALAKAGDAVADSARRQHGYKDRTGALTRSIGVDPVKGSFHGRDLSVAVFAAAPHARPIEFGSRAHRITAKRGGMLRWPVPGGGFAFAKSVQHPGTKPYKFLAGALETEFGDVTTFCEESTADAFESVGFEVQFDG